MNGHFALYSDHTWSVGIKLHTCPEVLTCPTELRTHYAFYLQGKCDIINEPQRKQNTSNPERSAILPF